MITAQGFLKEKSARVESALESYVAQWNGAPEVLVDAIRYSLFAGGKRLRPALALGAAEIVAGEDAGAVPAACAVEMIHTYSLIHDDLPAMDDDDMRRGKPTSHKVYGEATAILAGDTLLTMAFDIVASTGNAAVVRELAAASGVNGMAGGQMLDLAAEGEQLTIEALRDIHARKTGALIRASVRCGAMLAGAGSEQLDALTRYGENVGLAFQIADDVLNVSGAEDKLGKRVGSDAARGKSTYPSLVGLEAAREMAQSTVKKALDSLALFGPEADAFRKLARYVVERDA